MPLRRLICRWQLLPLDPTLDMMGLSTPIPPTDLIFLVVGHKNRRTFARQRRPPVDYILQKLEDAGIDVAAFDTILDFGCGCGRILAGWEGRLPAKTSLLGCDINPRLIEFCQANIPFAATFVSNFLPPLDSISDEQIDFVYAASVFTHLTPPAAALWADEMARIIKPNGILMLSFHGAAQYNDILARISGDGLRRLEVDGIYTHLHGKASQTNLGSNKYATFMKPDFVKAMFRAFDPIEMIPGTPNAFMSLHDVAILRRRPEV